MNDDRPLPAPKVLNQLLEATFGPQTAAIDRAVRRGVLDLGTAAELLEHQASARIGLTRLIGGAGA